LRPFGARNIPRERKKRKLRRRSIVVFGSALGEKIWTIESMSIQ
jgi:hypothetical protein